jgi:hypothetical protein
MRGATGRAAAAHDEHPANVAYLEEVVASGAFVEGASDPSLRRLRVVADG